jgi:hypothetical protein
MNWDVFGDCPLGPPRRCPRERPAAARHCPSFGDGRCRGPTSSLARPESPRCHADDDGLHTRVSEAQKDLVILGLAERHVEPSSSRPGPIRARASARPARARACAEPVLGRPRLGQLPALESRSVRPRSRRDHTVPAPVRVVLPKFYRYWGDLTTFDAPLSWAELTNCGAHTDSLSHDRRCLPRRRWLDHRRAGRRPGCWPTLGRSGSRVLRAPPHHSASSANQP